MRRQITLEIETSEDGRYCSPDCRPKDWNLCWACGVHAPLQFAEGTDRSSGLATFLRHPACLAAESRTYEDGVRAALAKVEAERESWSIAAQRSEGDERHYCNGRARLLTGLAAEIRALLPEAER